MRATGIVRRLDDLGRLVIPKEIRRVLGWKEGDPLELYCDRENKTIALKKYEVEDDDGSMKKYRVGIEISGYVERYVEAEDGGESARYCA